MPEPYSTVEKYVNAQGVMRLGQVFCLSYDVGDSYIWAKTLLIGANVQVNAHSFVE